MLTRIIPFLWIVALPVQGLADGVISTIAGASTLDGVPATQTLVNYPGGIAADGVGNVYISDTGNHRIRRDLEKVRKLLELRGERADAAP